MTLAVEVVDARKRLTSTQALAGVSVEFGDGIAGLLGPNGAGKTTLMRVLATVLAPDSGSVRLLGLNPADPTECPRIRGRLGYMPQEPGLHQRFTAFEFVDYVAILKEMPTRRPRHDEVRRVLALVGLDDVAQKPIKTLSSGMRRRVALAQALLGDPRLLILDEPTAGLDPEQRMHFREQITRLAQDRCVVIASHQTEDVAALCDQVHVLRAGATLFAGTPTELSALAEANRDHPTLEDGYLQLLGRTSPKEAT